VTPPHPESNEAGRQPCHSGRESRLHHGEFFLRPSPYHIGAAKYFGSQRIIMAEILTAPPVLSTPETHILSETLIDSSHPPEVLSDDDFQIRYEIQRTINEIRRRKWRRVALQFPDQMLPHSARVYQLLARGLQAPAKKATSPPEDDDNSNEAALSTLFLEDTQSVKLTILGDTSYGSCCVDEIAAEHVDADAVVHYGRACLSPTARLPVLHVYTIMDLDLEAVIRSFKSAFEDLNEKVVLTADVPYASHVQALSERLQRAGYTDIYTASIVHDPSSAIPNRTIPPSVTRDASALSQWSLFHISDPPTSLILTLQSRMATIKVYPTSTGSAASVNLATSTSLLLRRRYALVTSLTTVPVWGILINTLSVKNYLSMLSHIQSLISRAGKKSYLFVVGKLNPAKLANFSEVGGWVVIGCWESSLVDSKEFFKPIITPFELELVLMGDEGRVWTGEWRADFQKVLEEAQESDRNGESESNSGTRAADESFDGEINVDSESEDEPPEFDLRTGRYVSRTRPLQRSRVAIPNSNAGESAASPSTALAKKSIGSLISINGTASPGAEYLAQQRTWRGLGSDFEVRYEEDETQTGGLITEGRTGLARGYTIGEDGDRT
jgi:diphthamide biosynthesis protein 2